MFCGSLRFLTSCLRIKRNTEGGRRERRRDALQGEDGEWREKKETTLTGVTLKL